MDPRLVHPERLMRQFPQPAVLQIPDALLTPAPGPVERVESVRVPGTVGDKGLHTPTTYIGDA